MKININGKITDFDSGYNAHRPSSNGWQKQNIDAFKILSLNDIKVFVKRFEKDKTAIPGYHYIIKTKNKKLPNLPIIYDFVSTTENNKSVSYLFQEALEGLTLEEIIHNHIFNFNPIKFSKNIYSALESISKNGFWFSDFVEKNIFIANNGDYYLIDLDSVVPLSIMPCEDTPILSSVNKNYKIAVFNYFYKETFKYPFTYIRQNLRGDTINFLELFVLVAQFKYYLDKKLQPNLFDVSTRKAIPQYLLDKNNALTYAIFKSCFENTSNHQQVLSLPLFESYLKTVLFENDSLIKIDFNNKKVISGYSKAKTTSKNISDPQISIQNQADEKKEKVNKLIIAINNNLDRNQLDAAAKNIKKLSELDTYNADIKRYNNLLYNKEQKKKEEEKLKKIEDAKNELIKNNITPYRCSSCSFPVKQKEDNGFTSVMYLASAVVSVISLWQFLDWVALLGIIGGPIIWGILASILPNSWTKEKLKCTNCNKDYYIAPNKY